MSRIDDLVARLSPDGVPHRALREVARYSDTRVDASELDEANFVGVDNLLPDKGGRTDASYLPNTVRLTAYRVGDVLLGNIRPYLKKVWLADREGGCSGDVLAVRVTQEYRHLLHAKFLFYLLSSDVFFTHNMRHAKGAKMPRGDKAAVLGFRIPVPPLEVQLEIVRVLDQFTRLEAELAAELEARGHQYEHYRDQLLSFSGQSSPRHVPLGDLATIFRGKRFTKNDYVTTGGVGAIHYGEVYTHFNVSARQVVSRVRDALRPTLRYATKGDVVLTDVGETVEDVGKAVAWLGDEDVAIHDHCYVIRSDLDPTYLAYVMQTKAFVHAKERYIARTKVKTLLLEGLKRIPVPVPPIEEQRHIVSILDKFDALANDLSIGLPAELAARRKQYEYYRDKLLTFEEAPA